MVVARRIPPLSSGSTDQPSDGAEMVVRLETRLIAIPRSAHVVRPESLADAGGRTTGRICPAGFGREHRGAGVGEIHLAIRGFHDGGDLEEPYALSIQGTHAWPLSQFLCDCLESRCGIGEARRRRKRCEHSDSRDERPCHHPPHPAFSTASDDDATQYPGDRRRDKEHDSRGKCQIPTVLEWPPVSQGCDYQDRRNDSCSSNRDTQRQQPPLSRKSRLRHHIYSFV
ncbi:hypothetical protein Rrhod_3027 [Rhodococcus rhodnii LMG 5362]|uniref:Uncharacterized protein n=1 Tax=Rhodococcus rhodnii LMG 5362 TaxID=1273125 RepID=R7WJT7_9NOCA|nr:hypothetical protein Rrhod_3027 [Rhodococcus rhodnii LMG 5362]